MFLPTCPDLRALRELIVSPYLRSQVQVYSIRVHLHFDVASYVIHSLSISVLGGYRRSHSRQDQCCNCRIRSSWCSILNISSPHKNKMGLINDTIIHTTFADVDVTYVVIQVSISQITCIVMMQYV